MDRPHRFLPAFALVALGLLLTPPQAAAGGERPPGTCRIQFGGQGLTDNVGILPPGTPGERQQAGGVLGVLAFEFPVRQRAAWGLEMDIEGNRADLGQQTFGIATMRAMSTLEYMLASPNERRKTVPYALVGAGWNFNRVGVKVAYVGGAPSGIPLGLEMDDGAAVRAGLGLDHEVNRQLELSLEGGWKWNAGHYRLTFSGLPDRTGIFDLGGITVLGGVHLLFRSL